MKYLKQLTVLMIILFTIVGTGIGFADGVVYSDEVIAPRGMCYDAQNNRIVFADYTANAIFELNLGTMKIQKIAGKSLGKNAYGLPVGGYKDGDAKEALFKNPSDVAFLKSGAIIVADTGNHAIRQIYNGRVTTIAGGKLEGIHDGTKQIARFSYPSGVTVYNDTIYVSDTENNSIRKITTDGAVHTVGFKINKPSGIHMVGKELYVCSMEDHKIYVLQYDKLVRTVGGEKGYVNGRVEVAKFSRPTDVFSYKDDIYVVDSGNHAIRKISETKNKIRKVETVLGGKIGFRDEKTKRFLLDSPRSVFVVNNKLYVTDTHNSRIVTLDQVSKLTPVVDLQKCEDLSTVHIYVDGTRVVPQDVSPIIIKNSTYVPVRLLVENIGGEVEWISSESAVLCKYGDKQFKLKEGLVLRSGRTFVPLRQMMEKLGLKVEWNGEYRAVIISTY